jgi:hypothetical protein
MTNNIEKDVDDSDDSWLFLYHYHNDYYHGDYDNGVDDQEDNHDNEG